MLGRIHISTDADRQSSVSVSPSCRDGVNAEGKQMTGQPAGGLVEGVESDVALEWTGGRLLRGPDLAGNTKRQAPLRLDALTLAERTSPSFPCVAEWTPAHLVRATSLLMVFGIASVSASNMDSAEGVAAQALGRERDFHQAFQGFVELLSVGVSRRIDHWIAGDGAANSSPIPLVGLRRSLVSYVLALPLGAAAAWLTAGICGSLGLPVSLPLCQRCMVGTFVATKPTSS